jgi:subtilisin family serine protease
MRASPLMLAVALALGTAAGAADSASSPRDAVIESTALNTYIVVFDEPPAARFRGFGKAETGRPRLAATSPAATGARKYDARSLEAITYTQYLDQLRHARLNEASNRLGRPLVPTHVYIHAMNGMAIRLTASEAQAMAGMDGVRSVAPEFTRFLQTDRGPQWIKANLMWNGTATGTQRRGELVIVGVIDGGINHTHSAFAGTGITNPLGANVYRGYCAATSPAPCNSKLIGLWNFTSGNGSNVLPTDGDGHGTHTASTAAGNAFSIYSGVAPRANIIAYKACPDLECPGGALLASIDQAVNDGVDVINYSIGLGATDPWATLGGAINDDTEAFLAAREAGIVVAAAAGNDGPAPGTHAGPANSPWVLGVAAATHDRGGAGDRLASFSGRGPVVPLGVIKPDVTAPGVNIIAAGLGGSATTQTLSGTSMATPHVAGAAALLLSDKPTLTPSQVISALTLTARNSVTEAGVVTSPHLQGAGMVDVSLAARAGVFLEVPLGGFNAATANPFNGGAHNINLPSLGHGACFRTCTLTRTFKLMPGTAAANYSIQTAIAPGATLTPSVASFTTSAGGQAVSFTLNVDSPSLVGKWVYGNVTLVNTSGDGRPNLRLPVAVFATPFADAQTQAALAEVSRTVSRERDYFDLDLANLVALPSARFAATPLVAPLSTTQNIAEDPTADPYDNVQIHYRRLLSIPATPGGSPPVTTRVRVSTQAANPDIDLFVGRDSNGNSLPDEAEEICRSISSGSSELCEFTVQSEAAPYNLWVMVQNFDGPGTGVRVDSYVVPLVPGGNGSLVATGPGNIGANLPFKLRIAYDEPSLVAGVERIGFVLVQPAAGTTAFEIPVRLTRTGGGFEPFALANGTARAVTLPAGTSHDRLYFDVPPHATSVQFTTSGSTGNVDLYVARLASPSGPGIEAAPAWNNVAAFRAATGSGNETVTLTGANLQPGRHYVVPVNPTGGTVSANVTATVTAQGVRPAYLSGQYVNLARDGHGIFVDFSGPAGNPDQWVTVWYTYFEDTTPTWYYSQGAAPGANGIWKAELFRVVWDGATTHAVDVGDVIITPTGAETMTMNFNLDGKSGFEPMLRVGGGSCPQFNGQTLDVTGHWFSPSLAGFGYTYQATGGGNPQEVFIPYIYDGRGIPRWIYGQKNFASSPNSFNLQWFSGFPPLAPRVDLVGTPAGTGTRTLATNNVTNMSVNATFTGALTGNWVQNRPVAMLSQRKNCQ